MVPSNHARADTLIITRWMLESACITLCDAVDGCFPGRLQANQAAGPLHRYYCPVLRESAADRMPVAPLINSKSGRQVQYYKYVLRMGDLRMGGFFPTPLSFLYSFLTGHLISSITVVFNCGVLIPLTFLGKWGVFEEFSTKTIFFFPLPYLKSVIQRK